VEKLDGKVPIGVQRTGLFVIKLLVISCLVLFLMWTVIKPVIINQINPMIKLIITEAMKEELEPINYYVSEDILRFLKKQYEKITGEHINLYRDDVENAIKYYELIERHMPNKITPAVKQWMIVINNWYRGELS